MADQQKQANQQGTQNQQRATPTQGGQDSRSESLLPAGDSAGKGGDDGRFEVAEEVNLDQQSDATRRVGQAPESKATDAVADALRKS
jgi:hypothetical protein